MLNQSILLFGLGLQTLALFMAWRSRRENPALAGVLAVAAAVLATRGISVLLGATLTGAATEAAIVIVSAALVAACPGRAARATYSNVDAYAFAFLDKSPTPILIKDQNGRYLYFNHSFAKAFSINLDTAVGKKAEELWTNDLSDAARESDRLTLETGENSVHEVKFIPTDRPMESWLVTKFRLTLPSGQLGIATYYTDTTAQRTSERRLAESEERYALASRHAGIWDWDLTSGSVYVSAAFAKMLGLNENEAEIMTISAVNALFHPDDFDVHQRLLEDHLADPETPYDCIYRLRMQTGDYRWFRAVGKAVSVSGRRPRRMVGMITDIDAERHAADALSLGQARMATLLDNSPSPIYFKDLQLRFVMCNRRFTEVYQVSSEDILGKTSAALHGDAAAQHFIAHDQAVLDQRTLIVREEKIGAATFLTAKFPVFDGKGKLIGLAGIETEITDRVEVEKAYRAARDDAETANRAKSAFLANMSHELRTPLNSIIGFSDSLLAETLGPLANPRQYEYLNFVKSAGEHLLDVINDILDLSRIEAGKLELEENDVDLSSAISETVQLMSERAKTAGLLLINHIPDDLQRIRADERQIKQVVINLLSNALKFTTRGGRIEVSATVTTGGALEIHFSDTGIGIAQEDLERVQQPFAQIADALTRKHEGTGLGLAIVKSIIAMHGGDFRLESTVGEGTTAIVTIPPSRVLGET